MQHRTHLGRWSAFSIAALLVVIDTPDKAAEVSKIAAEISKIWTGR